MLKITIWALVTTLNGEPVNAVNHFKTEKACQNAAVKMVEKGQLIGDAKTACIKVEASVVAKAD